MGRERDNKLTASHSMVLKNGWVMISMNPVSLWQPSLSVGTLFKNPLRMEAALTLSDLGMRMVFSRMTAMENVRSKVFLVEIG